ncbi:hypothetical protein LPB142_05940 [Rhodobacter xanthinilyticus]|uniref:EF-hand domain-containing protein n=1 Tax=Rhodobacter xanthinilyticus TaxID=1850250 RepID=A0A1D9MAK1_9RHOB|nr:hypothetical protein [Rhodobacter xanthinilyticus]AOZ68915.1 hypothetical protein LPB142_05940 [Rhodobacter xanthinilyticus]
MTRLFPYLGAAAVAFVAAPALAAPPSFQSLDADGNGALSRQEFLAIRQAVFVRADRDGSQSLEAAEFEAAQAAISGGAPARGQGFAALDRNGDGRVTLAEFTANTPGFDRADRDGNGTLSPAEFDRVRRLIAQAAQ